MITRANALRIASVVALGGACAGIRPAPAPMQPFLERSYVSRAPADTSLLYEAQATAHFLLVDGLDSAFHVISSDSVRRSARAFRVIATPMFRVRQLKDSSAAVRTPSFMPRLAIEWLWATRGPLDRAASDSSLPVFGHVLLRGARIGLAHHSNGQAGCFRVGFEPESPRANHCVVKPGADTSIIRLNRADGDFSTTYLTGLLHQTYINKGLGDQVLWSVGGGLGADLHLPKIFGALSKEQRELYGSWRVRLVGEGMKAFGAGCDTTPHDVRCVFRGVGRLTSELERAPSVSKELAARLEYPMVAYRASAEASYAFDLLLRAGVFVRVHDGQDYYNIGFAKRRRVFMFGLMLDTGGQRIGMRIVQ